MFRNSLPFYVRNVESAENISNKINLKDIQYNKNEVSSMKESEVKRLVQSLLDRISFKIPYLFTKNQVKIRKSNGFNKELNIIMHFAPARLSGYQVCPKSTPGCISSCLNLAGHGRYSNIQIGRIKKTQLFFEHRELFARLLQIELDYWLNYAYKKQMTLAARLNGTSDIQWEVIFPWIFLDYPEVQFYDYTKIAKRFKGVMPSNYHLTFSKSENNQNEVWEVLARGGNVAIVFSDLEKAIKNKWEGFKVIDGTDSDRRFDEKKKRLIIGLEPLGEAKKDTSGFVVNN